MTELCKCTICELKEQIRAVWERLQTTIYGIRVNGIRQIPDGQGIIDIEIGDITVPVATDHSIGGVKSSADNGKVSVSDTGIMTANGLAENIALTEDNTERLDDIDGEGGSIAQIEEEIGALQTSVEGHTTQIGDLETALEVAEGDIDELDQDIVRIDGQIDAVNTAVAGQQTAIESLQTGKQDKLTAGAGITIASNVISSTKQIYTGSLADLIVTQNNNLVVTKTFDLVFVQAGNTPQIISTTVYGGVYASGALLGWIRGTSNNAGYMKYTSNKFQIITPTTTTTDIIDNRILSTSDMISSSTASWAIFV